MVHHFIYCAEGFINFLSLRRMAGWPLGGQAIELFCQHL
jgi:hypothetical protein